MAKLSLVTVLGFALLAGTGPANAVTCAAGVYHAGCVGPHGAVATTRSAYRPAYHPGAACYWRNGVRVCR
jgi:hypothetical protein